MTNLHAFSGDNLFKATTGLFNDWGIRLNSNTDQIIDAKALLNDFYKDREPFTNIRQLYFPGLIEDSVFGKTPPRGYSLEEANRQADRSYDGLMLFALELSKAPSRTEIAELTRAFNRTGRKMSVALLLKYESRISIAFSERFFCKSDRPTDGRIGKIIILRDICIENPHPGDLRILQGLAKHQAKNFNELRKAWVEALDVTVLNKRFYAELSNWYFEAIDQVQFPEDKGKTSGMRNTSDLIRLIIRFLFIRFIKEKGLVPEKWFNPCFTESVCDTEGKTYNTKELILLFDSYKFTVTENTPTEEDVVLDPELLGKVFENLSASYNPETKTTARKQTGSFYTPREIVNYMVDESLKACFLTKIIVQTLNNLKILDPACGSGAFPMGILHRMVEILQKLDPENKEWRRLQEEKAIEETKDASGIINRQEREARLKKIKAIFENNTSDYGRKFFLIENCIFGVDIQPIAVEITRLRLLISLIAEQETNPGEPNPEICNLPNLEAKFAVANALTALDKPETFDVVIGNPPYVDYRKIDENQKQHLEKYEIARHSKMINLYTYFFEKGIDLLKPGGNLIFITPQQFLVLDNCKGLRDIIRKNRVISFSDFSNVKVFKASTYPFISFIKKEKSEMPITYYEFESMDHLDNPKRTLQLPNPLPEPVCISDYAAIIRKIDRFETKLKDISTDIFCASSSRVTIHKEDTKIPFVTASDIQKYYLKEIRQFIDLQNYSVPSMLKQQGNVIYTSRMTRTVRACRIEQNTFLGGKVNVIKLKKGFDERFILGILNSRLISFWYREKYSLQHLRGGSLPVNTTELEKIPIPNLSVEQQQPLIAFVDQILSAKKENPAADTSDWERQIDELVYELYGLAAAEVKIADACCAK